MSKEKIIHIISPYTNNSYLNNSDMNEEIKMMDVSNDNSYNSDNESMISIDNNQQIINNNSKTFKCTFEGKGSIRKLEIILKGSSLEYLTKINELQDEVYHNWCDIISGLCDYDKKEEINDWEIIAKLFNLQTIIDNSVIMTNVAMYKFKQLMQVLYADTKYEFYSMFLRNFKDCIDGIDIVKDTGLGMIYEQLVFYEYIYLSPIYSFYHKIRWMIDFGYFQLIKLLDNHYLNVLDQCIQENNSLDDYIVLMVEYIQMDDFSRTRSLKTLLDLHSKILDFDPELVTNCNSVKLHNMFSDEQIGFFDLQDYTDANSINRLANSMLLDNFYDKCSKGIGYYNVINFQSLFGLNKKILKSLVINATKNINKNIIDTYSSYCIINLVMRMMEDDLNLENVCSLNNNILSRVVYTWFINSSRIIEDSNLKNTVLYNNQIISTYLLKTYTRNIKLSNTLRNVLKLVNIDFGSLQYLYLTDRNDIFEILTRNCEFKMVDTTILEYCPINIINYILRKNGKTQEEMINTCTSRDTIVLDLYKLCMIGLDRTKTLIDVIIRLSNKRVLFATNLKRYEIYGHISYEYPLLLHELEELHKLGNLDGIISHVFLNNYPIQEAVKLYPRYANCSILATILYALYSKYSKTKQPNIINQYIEFMILHPDFERCGPELGDIWYNMSWFNSHKLYQEALDSLVKIRNSYVNLEEDKINLVDYSVDLGMYINPYDVNHDQDQDSDSDQDSDLLS